MKCPVCRVPFVRERRANFPIQRCPQCHGHLVNFDRLATIKRSRELGVEQLKQEVLDAPGGDSLAPLRCPGCRVMMEKQLLPPPAEFHLDRCAACELVWLDGGELAAFTLKYQISDQALEAAELRRRHEQMSPERREALEQNLQKLPLLPEAGE
jgi:Zn-finger nucleic acid-binding protein